MVIKTPLKSTLKDEVVRFLAAVPNLLELGSREVNKLLYNAFSTEKTSSLRQYKSDYLVGLGTPEEIVKARVGRKHKIPLPNAHKPKGMVAYKTPTTEDVVVKKEKVYDQINIETVHDLLLRWANQEFVDPQLVKYCIDYCKGFKERLKQDEVKIDLEGFEELGKSTTDNRSICRQTKGDLSKR